MILKLRKNKIEIVPMPVPLRTERFDITIDFEPGTQHLVPKVYIDDVLYNTEDFNRLLLRKNKRVDMRVDLIDHFGRILRTYRCKTMYYNYSLFGELPHRVDYEEYIKELETRIRVLEEMGEVI